MHCLTCRLWPILPGQVEIPLKLKRLLWLGLSSLFGFSAIHSSSSLGAEPQLERISDNVYVVTAAADEGSVDNKGQVANTGFIVGSEGVIVVDTGVSYRQGQHLLESIRQVTDKPVKLVVVTHAVREFVFGSAAFEEIGAPLLAHRETVDLMKARCGHCLKQLQKLLQDEMADTRLVLPTIILDASKELTVGGERIRLLHYGWAATPGDIAVYHEASSTLFAGGLVSSGHVPLIRDADFEGWLAALGKLRALSPLRVVPGFGPPSDARAIEETTHYLKSLDAQARRLYEENASLLEAMEGTQLPGFENRKAYVPNHRRNALHRRLQLETEDLGGDPRSTEVPEQ